MKVQRYLYGQRNVGLLKEGRAALRSPEAVAREAALPYDTGAEVAGAASDVLFDLAAKQKETKIKTAAVNAQTQTSFMTNAVENLPLEAERNNWTAEQMAENGKAILRTYEDSLNAIDPEFQDDLRSSWNINKAMYAQQISGLCAIVAAHPVAAVSDRWWYSLLRPCSPAVPLFQRGSD